MRLNHLDWTSFDRVQVPLYFEAELGNGTKSSHELKWLTVYDKGSSDNGGHYICAIKDGLDGRWLLFNDSQSQELTDDQVTELASKATHVVYTTLEDLGQKEAAQPLPAPAIQTTNGPEAASRLYKLAGFTEAAGEFGLMIICCTMTFEQVSFH